MHDLPSRSEISTVPQAGSVLVRSISELSNARFSGLRSLGKACITMGDADERFVIGGVSPDSLASVEQSFNLFVERLKEASDGISEKQRLQEAHEAFDQGVLPALRQAGVALVDAKKYDDSMVMVSPSNDRQAETVDQELLPCAQVTMKIPMRRGWRRYFNAAYCAHARFEETIHFFQYVNEGPLTTMGLSVEQALRCADPALMGKLTKDWTHGGSERQRRFVRENDVAGVYRELGINPPGLFYYFYDRRPVRAFMTKKIA